MLSEMTKLTDNDDVNDDAIAGLLLLLLLIFGMGF